MAREITSNSDLWQRVGQIADGLRAAGSDDAALRLNDVMAISGNPGEVWPATRDVLAALIYGGADGLDIGEAAACLAVLRTWPT